MTSIKTTVVLIALQCVGCSCASAQDWSIRTQQDWAQAQAVAENVEVADGLAKSTAATSRFASVVKRFPTKQTAKSITFKQSKNWDNWREVPNVGPADTQDAIVLLPVKPGDYWLLARKHNTNPKKLKATRQDRDESELGYHAWHSTDMKTWKHCGPVCGFRERWVTTAEYADGKFYIFYDHPNDQDPHLIVDEDLSDGKMGKDIGMVFDDPSHGSDCGVLRDDADGLFHMFYENWDPIDAKAHSWDSPLAGHAVSPDAVTPFKLLNQAVDHRTKPTGRFGTYPHSSSTEPLRYEIHEPEQDAYGDWTAIKIGGQYYLFCDYHPAGGKIKVGRFTSDSLDKEFTWCGSFGGGHPDPTIGFAEGQFYLLQQRGEVDFVSPGPWVPGVEARVGVDVSGDGQIEKWTDWQEVKETYSQKPGYARIVETKPASIDMSSLPPALGFAFEYRTKEVADQTANVVLDDVEMILQQQ